MLCRLCLCSEEQWHVYLLKRHNRRIKLGYKVSIFVRLRALLEKFIHQQPQSVAQRVERIYWLCFIDAQRHYVQVICGHPVTVITLLCDPWSLQQHKTYRHGIDYSYVSVHTVCCAFLQRSCKWILILYVANRPRPLTNGSSATRCLPETTYKAAL